MANKMIRGLTVEIGGDTTKLGKALSDTEKNIRDVQSELRQVEKLLKLDPTNTELLAQKQKLLSESIDKTSDKLDTLRNAEKQVQAQFKKGEVSEEQVRALQREIIATEKALDKYKNSVEDTTEETKDLAESTEKAGDSTEGLGSKLANVAKTGVTVMATACTALIGALVASAEATREYRTEMGKLEASFTSSGHSSESAQKAYKELYGIIGETDQAVEASQQIALIAKSEEDVAKWAGLASGVVGRFGDALQPETFYESANETLKLGEATGAYTQMLEGCGINVETFNDNLAKCNTEAEKQEYIYKVANQALGEAGKAYEKNNAEIIRANEATDEWLSSMSEIGGAIEPILTDIKLLGASLLSDFVPGVKAVAEAFRGVLNGDEGASAQLGESISGIFDQLLTKLVEALPRIVEVAGSLISTLASTLTAQIPTLLTTGGQIVANLATGIVNNLPQLAQSAMNAITDFASGFQTYLPIIVERGREILTNLGTGIRENLPNLVSQALDALMSFATTIYDNAPSIIDAGFELLSNLVQGILNSLPALLSKGPEIISKFANVINDNFPRILAKGIQLIGQIIKGIIKAIPTLIANIPKIITAIVDVWEAFNWLNLGKKAIKLLKDGIVSMIGTVKNAGKSIANGLTNIIRQLPSKLSNIGRSMISNFGQAIRSGWGNVKTGATTIFNGIINLFKGLPSKLLGVGKDLVKGLWNGISDMTGWIVGKIEGFGDSVLGGIKKFFGIKSPSRLMRDEVGRYVAEGIGEGIAENADSPLDALRKLGDDMANEDLTIDGATINRKLNTTFGTTGAGSAINGTSLMGMLQSISEKLGHLQVVLDSGVLVGEILDPMDNALSNKYAKTVRGW